MPGAGASAYPLPQSHVILTVGGSGAPVATVFNEEKQFGKHGSPRCERKNADGTSKLLLCELPGPRNSYSVTDVFSKHDHHDNLHPHGLLTRCSFFLLFPFIWVGLR